MPDGLEDVQTFAQRIKQKYVDYADVPDYELVARIAAKYPQYQSRISSFNVPGAEKLSGVSPTMLQHYLALYDQFQQAGIQPIVKAGFRTAEQENALFRAGYPTKGNDGYNKISPHQEGRALDLSFSPQQKARGQQILAQYARANGLHIPSDEPWHIAVLKSGRELFGTEPPPDEPPQQPSGVPLPPVTGTIAQQQGRKLFELTPKERERIAGPILPKTGGVPTMADVITEAKSSPQGSSVRSQIAKQVEDEMNSLSGNLSMALHPIDEITKSREQVFNEEVDRRVAAYERSLTPEMIAERKQVGSEGAIVRAFDVPVSKFVAGLGKTAAGITSGFGLAPNRLSDYLTKRAQVIDESTDSPIDESNNPIVRSLPEKVTSAVVGLGLTVAQLAILKRATGLGLGTIMATETALQTSDMPLKDRAAEVTRSYAMGRILDQRLSRPVSAALFGGPTAIQSGLAYTQGKMTLEDALLETGIQAGAGAIMGGKGERGVPESPFKSELRIEDLPDIPVRSISEPRVIKADNAEVPANIKSDITQFVYDQNQTLQTRIKAAELAGDQPEAARLREQWKAIQPELGRLMRNATSEDVQARAEREANLTQKPTITEAAIPDVPVSTIAAPRVIKDAVPTVSISERIAQLNDDMVRTQNDLNASQQIKNPTARTAALQRTLTTRLGVLEHQRNLLLDPKLQAIFEGKSQASVMEERRGGAKTQPPADVQRGITQQLVRPPTEEGRKVPEPPASIPPASAENLQSQAAQPVSTETTAPVLEDVSAASVKLAPTATAIRERATQFAALREGAATGERHALDLTDDLSSGLNRVSALRQQGADVLDSVNADPSLTPFQRQVTHLLDRDPEIVGNVLDNYLKGAGMVGTPQEKAFFEKNPPTKEALLEAAIRETVRDANKEISLFEGQGVRSEPETGRSVPNIDQASQPVSEGVPEPNPVIAGGSAAAANESGTVLRSSLAPGVPEFIQQDVLPTAKSFGAGIVETLKGAAQFLSPRSFAPKEGVDILMKMKGNRDKAEFLFQKSMEEVKANFERMPQADLVDFMDRYKRGMPQATPELQAVADSYKALNDEMYAELKKWKPSLPYLEDHFRVFWKVIPGAPEAKGFSGIFRRPLQGTRGMLKQHTLADVSEGIARGGEPVSYNPQVLQELGYADSMKFITAQRMWQAGKDVGLVKFFKNAERGKIPDDYAQIKDPIAKVYFPTEGGLSSPGEWYAQEDFARLINNHLSRDYIREAALGRGAMWLKNQMTMVELGLSGFHAVFETNEAVASSLGQGMRRIWNLGVLKGQPEQIAKGLGEIIAAPISPAATARAGGSAIEYLTNKEEFLKTTRGQSFIKQFPEANQMLDDLFTGGGQVGMSEAYRTNTTRAFNEAIANGNYPGALLRALPAFNEQVMKPLFQVYIPRLKVGQFLKEYQLMLQEYKPDLESGRLTRPELARKTWDFVEDRYGEMNFDNLFWDRTFKTSAQLLFRSVTWQLGNLRASFGALPEQAAEIGRSVRNGQVPRLTPKMSWFAGQALVTATMGAIITKAFTGNWPQKLSDYVYPRTDKDDPSQRLSIPTYIRVLTGLVRKPTEAIPNAASSEISRSMEIWRNRDYYGTQVFNPDDPLYKKAPEIIGHFIPVPFSISSFLKSTEQGQPIWKSAASFAGFTKAPAYAYQTPAQERISELLQRKYGSDVKTQRQADRSTLMRDIRVALREKNSERATELIRQGQASGQLTIGDVMGITKASGQSPLKLSFESLAKEVDSYDGLNTMLDVYENYMNEDERQEVRPVLVKKQLALIGLNSVGRGMKPTELRATPAEQQALRDRLNKALGVRSVPPPPQ